MAFGAVKKLFVQLGFKGKDFEDGLSKSEQRARQFQDKVGSGFKSMASKMAAAFSVVAITRFFKKAVEAAGVQEQAERKLQEALQQTGQYTDANFEKLKQYASEIQRVSTVGDETVLTLMQLGTSMGVQVDQLDDASKKAIGLSKAYGVDLKSAMKMVALARQGEYTMLQRYIPQIRGVTDETEKAAIANQAMADGWKVAQSEVQTFPGKVEQLKNSFGDMLEVVGQGITENKSFNESLTSMQELFADPGFQQGIAEIASKLAEVLSVVMEMVTALPRLVGMLKELNVVEEQQMGVFQRAANQTDTMQDSLRGFFDQLENGKAIRKQVSEDFIDIADHGDRALAMMMGLASGKYGEKVAADWKKYREESAALVKETEKQVKVEPKLKGAIDATVRSVDGKTDALQSETRAARDDVDATEDLTDELMEWATEAAPTLEQAMADLDRQIMDDIDASIELMDATDDVTESVENNQSAWKDMMAEMARFTGIAGAIGDAFGALGFDVSGLTQGIEKMMAGFSTGNWWDAASGMIQGVQTMISWLEQFGDFGVSQSQVARRAVEAFGDSVFLSADTIRDLAKAMEEAGITEYGEAAKKFADEWLRANGYMDDLIEKSLEFRRGWIESGGRSKDTGRDPGGDREYGRDLPGLPAPPPGGMGGPGLSTPHVFAAEGFSGVVTQPTRFTVGEAGPEHVQVTPGGEGGQVASIHIHNEAGAYTSQDFLRDLRIGRYTREIQDALRITQ